VLHMGLWLMQRNLVTYARIAMTLWPTISSYHVKSTPPPALAHCKGIFHPGQPHLSAEPWSSDLSSPSSFHRSPESGASCGKRISIALPGHQKSPKRLKGIRTEMIGIPITNNFKIQSKALCVFPAFSAQPCRSIFRGL
jgi:hypothetical protein